MPIITFVIGYVYLVFGSFKTFNSIGFDYINSYISSAMLAIIMMFHVWKTAKTLSDDLVCPRTFALQLLLTHFSLIIVIAAIIALEWIPQSLTTKVASLLLFALFGYLLNIGAGNFPMFSVADPFHWSRNRHVSPAYERAFKATVLAFLSYFFSSLNSLWHSVATGVLVLVDVVLMAHYWEIAGFDDWEEPRRDNRVLHIPEDPVIDDLHMD
ncbi:hypothetical protein CAEBREN_20791 [Caenorhabditis brenneri]|uniref:Uncharacterized protein n=1 Tax=Caenorhabditis brenneri TaxID=135651 RepID=G0NKA3_CAEBE|nr:hypothetical protein CAEBREN_20791 [Caenorhabditis brenneri]